MRWGGAGRSPLRILAHVHGYPPQQNAGAEWMLHTILRWLVRRGHEARVILGPVSGPYELDGVSVIPAEPRLEGPAFFRWAGVHARWADVVLTHLDCTQEAAGLARVNGKPIVHLVHNEGQLSYHRVTDAALIVFNSEWVSRAVRWAGHSMIVRPPVFVEDYLVQPNGEQAVTLISTIELKGAPAFFQMATRMADRRFIAVRGAYGKQVDPEQEIPNLTILENTPDIRSVYARTRVLAVPSSYESWSRCAIEACASGIPVIAGPTPGLRESLDYAGMFLPTEDIGQWCRAIRNLDDSGTYAAASAKGRRRAAELQDQSEGELEEFERALLSLRA